MESVALSVVDPGRRVSVRELERWASLAAASAVMAYGFSRRTVPGVCLAAAAAPIAYRGIVGSWPFANGQAAGDTRSALAGGKGIHVREAVRLEIPIAHVYRFWRTLGNLPRFLTHLERVTEFGDGRSHWVAEGPAGVSVEWDAEIINEVENKVIGWRSLPDRTSSPRDRSTSRRSAAAGARRCQCISSTRHRRDGQARGSRCCSGGSRRKRFERICAGSNTCSRPAKCRARTPRRRGSSDEGRLLLRHGRRPCRDGPRSRDSESARRHRAGHVDGHLRIRPAHLRRLHPDHGTGRRARARVHG